MNPIDYAAMAQKLMQGPQRVADDPFSRRDAVNPLMGLEGAGGPRGGGGYPRETWWLVNGDTGAKRKFLSWEEALAAGKKALARDTAKGIWAKDTYHLMSGGESYSIGSE